MSAVSAQSIMPQSWYAVQTRYQWERRVTTGLQQKGLETFLPLLVQTHRWTDRNKRIAMPLFSGYTFARLNGSVLARRRLLETSGVVGLISFAGEASPVPEKQIDDLRTLLAATVSCSLHPFLKVGQRVRIRSGCLAGIEGILTDTDKRSLVISIASIEHSVSIKIAGYELELI